MLPAAFLRWLVTTALTVIMLAFISKYFPLIPAEKMQDVVHKKLGRKAEFVELNNKAFALGLSYEPEV